MAIQIEDGTGSGYTVEVSSDNRLLATVRTTELIEHITNEGRSFNIITGPITLTSANESALLYIKNTNQNYSLELYTLSITFGKSTVTNGTSTVRLYKNPTGGTLISGGTTNTPINRNFNDNTPAISTVLQGVEGSTITGGTLFDVHLQADYSNRLINYRAPFMPNGSSLAISVQPPATNTSMSVTITAVVNYLNIAQV